MAIQLFKPVYDVEGCIAQIKECFEAGWTGMGFKTEEFEKQWKKYTGLNNALFLNSCTAALNLAVFCLKEEYGWEDDSEVISTPNTFISTNHAIHRNSLHVKFVDIDETMCIDYRLIEKSITPKTKAIMYVGIGGNAGNYERIVEICQKHNLKLILDAAHMAGTRLNGEIPGKEADAVCYSFQAVKNLPTADSGVLCFKERKLDEMARKISWLGINKNTYNRFSGGTYKWEYDVEFVGDKYNGNSIMAAIALAQLPHLDDDNCRRKQIADMYRAEFEKHGDLIKLVSIPSNCESSHHLFQIIVDDRNGLMEYLNNCNIYPGVHYVDNTKYSMYEYAEGTCPVARYVSEHVLSLPIHMQLSDNDVKTIIEKVVCFVTGELN